MGWSKYILPYQSEVNYEITVVILHVGFMVKIQLGCMYYMQRRFVFDFTTVTIILFFSFFLFEENEVAIS